jgi:hypothetical protein
MMVSHAYLELQRQDTLAMAFVPNEHIMLGDIQRKHQALSCRMEIALIYDLAQRSLSLASVYQRLAA